MSNKVKVEPSPSMFIEEALSLVASEEDYSLSDDDLSLSSDLESDDEDESAINIGDDKCLQKQRLLQETKKVEQECTILEEDSLHEARRRVLPAKIWADAADENCCIEEDDFEEEEYDIPLKGGKHEERKKMHVMSKAPVMVEPPEDLKVQKAGQDYDVKHKSQFNLSRSLVSLT